MKFLLYIFLYLMIISNQYASEPQFDLNKFSVYYPLDSNSNKFYFPLYQENDPKVTIVLSGGGARGLAQIGVLKNFEQSGIAIDNIVGTSIGAFIGGLYSSGYGANQLEQIADTTSWDDLFSISEESRSDYFLDQKEISDRSILRLRFQDFNFIVPDAISTGNQFNDYLNVLFWNSIYHSDNDYDKLKYKFRATATDLVTGQPVILSSGNIIKSIKASGNLPLRNSPVKIDSMLLIDGGIFQNIPTEAAGTFKSDFIILVKTVSPLMKIVELNKPWNIADQVVSIMMKKFEESAEKSADFIITPGLDSIRNTDFQLASKIIGIGSESVDDDLLKGKLETLRHDKIEKHYIDNYQNFSLNNLSADNSMSPDLKNNLEHIINNSAISDTSKFERLIQFAEDNNIKCLFITKDISGKNIISIEEFPVIKRIELNCNSLNLGELENLVNIEYSNARLNENNFKKICENIIGYARQLHFSFALIKNVRFSDGKLTFHVDEGKADIIQIKTKLNAQDYLVFRELKIKQGKDLNLDDIRSSWENLISTDLFSDVNFDFSHNKKDTSVDVTLSIREKGNQMLSFGVYLDNERYLQAGIDLIHYNLFNTGAQFTLRNVGGVRNFGSNISILQQRFLNTMVTARISGYYSYIKRWKFTNDYDLPSNRFASLINGEVIEEAVGIKASAGFQLAKLGNIKIEYRFERQRNYLRDSLKKNPFMTINSISVGTVFDSRDRIDFARRGRFINLSIETSLFRTTSEPTFSRLTFMQVNNFSLGKSTFRPRIIFSIADRTLPFNEFFRIGGENTFYGYSEDEIYGRQVALGSLEYEIKMPFKLLFDTYFSLRYDIGSAWLTPETIKLRNLKNGFGLCLSLDTPIGPARLAGGEAFYFQSNPNGAKFGYPHLYFSIGVRL